MKTIFVILSLGFIIQSACICGCSRSNPKPDPKVPEPAPLNPASEPTQPQPAQPAPPLTILVPVPPAVPYSIPEALKEQVADVRVRQLDKDTVLGQYGHQKEEIETRLANDPSICFVETSCQVAKSALPKGGVTVRSRFSDGSATDAIATGLTVAIEENKVAGDAVVLKLLFGVSKDHRSFEAMLGDMCVLVVRPSQIAGQQPADNWPNYSGELFGPNEVRVVNPNDINVKVGLRSDHGGLDFMVFARKTVIESVPDGDYEVIFQFSTDPNGLYKGDAFSLEGNGIEIQIVQVPDGTYGIRKVH